MSVQATAAAHILEQKQDEISSHQLISLLMDGGLERIAQARQSIEAGNEDEAKELVGRLIGIINGLRNTLNFEQGGETATNLDSLYEYMLSRMDANAECIDAAAVTEVGELLSEVKVGWDKIEA